MGTLVLAGATSGSTTLTPVDAVTTVLTLPSATATLATLGANTFAGNQSITGTLGVTGTAIFNAGAAFKASSVAAAASQTAIQNSSGVAQLAAYGVNGSTNGSYDFYTTRSDASNTTLVASISGAGAVTIPGTLGVTGAITGTTAALTSTVEAGLTISRSTDATVGLRLSRSGGGPTWAMYRYGSSDTDKFAIGRIGVSEDLTITTAGIVTMVAYGAGTATFSAAGVISSVSDETWKIKDGLPTDPDAMLQKLAPGYWFYNDEKKEIFGTERQLGFYAQNVNAAIGPEAAPEPETVTTKNEDGTETTITKPWGYYDRSVLAVTVMSLQKALATIESLTARITALEAK